VFLASLEVLLCKPRPHFDTLLCSIGLEYVKNIMQPFFLCVGGTKKSEKWESGLKSAHSDGELDDTSQNGDQTWYTCKLSQGI